jgi:hypothetical protein
MHEQSETDRHPHAGLGSQFKWLLTIFIRPRKTFAQIAVQPRKQWLLPLLVMSVAALIHANVAARTSVTMLPGLGGVPDGNIQIMNGEDFDPSSFDEMGDENADVIEITDTGILPASNPAPSGGVSWLITGIGSLIRIWGGWLLVSAMLYLALTLSGGRVENRPLMNAVAWAGLPLALRDLVRIVSMTLTRQAILNPGLSGLWIPGDSMLSRLLLALLNMVDIYLIWHLALLVIGGKAVSGLETGKALKAVLIPMLILLLLYALGTVGVQTLAVQIQEGASSLGGGF